MCSVSYLAFNNRSLTNGFTALLPVLNRALADLGELPAREIKPLRVEHTPKPLYFHDATERPINRPKDPQDQKTYYSGKKTAYLPQE